MNSVSMKIRKLLDLAEDQKGTAEAESAMLKAQELLLKNDLTMDSIESLVIEEEKEAVDEIFSGGGKKLADWKKVLANVIGKNFRVEVLLSNYNSETGVMGTFLHLVGLKEDVQIASSIIKFAWKIAEERAYDFILKHNENNPEYLKYKRCGKHKMYTNAVKRDFYYGFIDGVREKFRKQVEEKSLILVKDQLVVQKLQSMGVTKRNVQYKSGFGSKAASQEGFKNGRNLQKDYFIK